MLSIAPTTLISSGSRPPRYSGKPSRRNNHRGRSRSRFHTHSKKAGRMSLPLRQHAAIDPRMISATSGYAGIDTVLIGLASAFDLGAVSALFNERWGSPASRITVIARSVHDVDYHPSTRCRVTYELSLELPNEEPSGTFGVVNVRPDGLDTWVFNEDRDLPWLAHATDPGELGR